MKPHFIIAGCLGLVMWGIASQGQNLVWAKQFSGTSNEEGSSIITDASGNVYTVGSFGGTVDFNPGPDTFNLTATYVQFPVGNTFITKLDGAGNFIWAKQFQGVRYNNNGRAITLDADGYIYVTGLFGDTVDFDPGPGVFNLISSGIENIFVVKLDASGNFVWAKQIGGGQRADQGWDITSDTAGNVYVTGTFTDTVDFDTGPGIFNLIGLGVYDNIFIAKLDSSGNLIWAKQIGSANNGFLEVNSITANDGGNVYVTGYFPYTIEFDPGVGTLSLTALGVRDAFITKLDVSGNFIWAKQFGGTGNSGAYGYSIVVDEAGDVYTTGQFYGTVDFDPGPGTFNLTSPPTSVFTTKLDISGNFIWAKQLVGNINNGYSSIDADGNLYITGYFNGTGDFDPSPSSFNLTTAGFNVFIAALDSSGDFIWAKHFGNAGNNYGQSIAVDAAGNAYTTGKFTGIVDFDTGPGTVNLSSAGYDDVFVLKVSQSSLLSYHVIRGKVFLDLNSNCTEDSSDFVYPSALVKAEPGPFYGLTDTTGSYTIHLTDTGSYTISLATRDLISLPSCTSSYNIHVTQYDTTNDNNFAREAAYNCPRLTIDLAGRFIRACAPTTIAIRYGNTGLVSAQNVYAEIDFGEYIQVQSSSIPWSSVSGNEYTFPIGNLNINQQGDFYVQAQAVCNGFALRTHCITARIYPDEQCLHPDTAYYHRQVRVSGICASGDSARFTIANTHDSMGFTMSYQIFINSEFVTNVSDTIAPNDTLVVYYPANGNTVRLEVSFIEGQKNYPGPQYTIEACGSPAVFGNVNTLPQNDDDENIETLCIPFVASFDPNDKQVFPTGVTANRYIKPDSELEYLIRFQNIGNDTAFKVVIRDTIQTDVIDIATLTSGASSHEYTFNIYGHGIAEWTFDNILLPDSNVNEPESHGFVKFKAKLLPNITPGTIVTNSADIYFDFNAPIITNEVWNTVFDTVLRAPVVISGTILTESNTPVPNVTVKLAGSAADSTITAADGRYDFEVEPGGTYTITPSKNNDAIPSNGLTTYDILTIRRHLLGIGALPSPYKIIAASEVNAEADTSVTTQDIVLIRSLILGNTTSFPGNRMWQFVSSDQLFSNTQHPFPFNKTRTYTNIISSQTNQNFIGIKLGDVNESWDGN